MGDRIINGLRIQRVSALPSPGKFGKLLFLDDFHLYCDCGTRWIDLTAAERIALVETLPTSGLVVGDVVCLATDSHFYYYDGADWVDLTPVREVSLSSTDEEYTIPYLAFDTFYLCFAKGDQLVNLPDALAVNKRVTIKNPTTNVVTVATTNTIDGASTVVLSNQFDSITVQYSPETTAWSIIAKYP